MRKIPLCQLSAAPDAKSKHLPAPADRRVFAKMQNVIQDYNVLPKEMRSGNDYKVRLL